MKCLDWNTEKSDSLRTIRGIGFEDIVFHVEHGDVLDDYAHPNQEKCPEQSIMVVGVNNYAYLVPYVETDDTLFLKTIIPSRKATEKYFWRER